MLRPGGPWALVVALLCAPLAAEERWLELRSDNFRIVTDGDPERARKVVNEFEEIRAVFHQLWPEMRVDPGRPIVILAARNERGLRALLPGYWEKKGTMHPAGLYQSGPEKHFIALRLDAEGEAPFHVLHHEYVHVLLDLNFAELPLWLNEGLAEFWANAEIEGDRVHVGRPQGYHILLLRQREPLPLARLLGADHGSPEYTEDDKATIFYAQSWALVHFLMLGRECKQNGFAPYLAALDKGLRGVAAAQSAFGDLAAFEKTLDGYIRSLAFCGMTVRRTSSAADAKRAPRALSAAESLAVRGDFLAHTNRLVEARTLLEAALAQDPALAAAHEALGTLAWREQKLDAARLHLAEAVRLQSDSFLAHYLYGALLTQDGSARGAATAAFARAIELNHDYAPGYEAYARLLAEDPSERERALGIARRAVSLEPRDAGHRIVVGQILLQMGKLDEAAAEAERAATSASSDPDRARVRELADAVARMRASPQGAGQGGAWSPATRVPSAPEDQAAAAGRGCDSGDQSACLYLGWLHQNGEGVAKDGARAVSLFERVCAKGGSEGCLLAAAMYDAGSGVARDMAKAIALYASACEAAGSEACTALGVALVRQATPASMARGAEAFAKGCDQGQMASCSNLAALTRAGQGAPRNAARARELYKKACDGGYPPACRELEAQR